VTQTNPSPATQVESYTYDTEGNRVASHISPAYVTDPANRVLDDGINTYTWSPDGSMTSRTPKANSSAGITFQSDWYGYFNQVRLDSIGGAFPMRFLYDPQGRNVFRAFDYDPTLGQFARYHDGPDMVLEQREAGSSSPLWVRYVHGPNDDQPLALEIYPVGANPTPGTGSQYYYHADGEGSIRLLTDANAQIANEYSYDSYGQRLTTVESVPQPFGWKGREWIPGPNIYFNRFRFYDPAPGRFSSEDPTGYGSGDWNFYSFAWNDPHNWNDPSGLLPLDENEEQAVIEDLAGGAVPIPGNAPGDIVIHTPEQAAEVAKSTGSPLQAVGANIACSMFELAAALDAGPVTPDRLDCGATPNLRIKKRFPTCRRFDVGLGMGFSSFAAGTLVQTALGEKRIEEIEIGDVVAARDEFTGEIVWRPVRELFRRKAPAVMHLTLQGSNARLETIDLTSEHPLLVEGKGWLEARRLSQDDRIVVKEGAPSIVTKISRDETPTLVYNFELAQDHNYFVGDLEEEAHNGGPPTFWKRIYQDPKTPSSVGGWIRQELNRNGEKWERIRNPPGMDCGHHPSNRGAHDDRSRLEWISDNRGRPGKTGNNRKWR